MMQNLHVYRRTKFLTRVHLSLTLVPSNQELTNNGWDDGVDQFWRNFLFFPVTCPIPPLALSFVAHILLF